MVPTAETLAELEQKHGRIAVVQSRDRESWCVVMRKPTRKEYKMFRSYTSNPQHRADAQENLFLQICVIPPTRAEADKLLDEYPGIPEACTPAMLELLGLEGIEQGK